MKVSIKFLEYDCIGVFKFTEPVVVSFRDKYELNKLVHKYVDNWLAQQEFDGFEVRLISKFEEGNLF